MWRVHQRLGSFKTRAHAWREGTWTFGNTVCVGWLYKSPHETGERRSASRGSPRQSQIFVQPMLGTFLS
jgi:hypothetical protein